MLPAAYLESKPAPMPERQETLQVKNNEVELCITTLTPVPLTYGREKKATDISGLYPL
jgi:hypothetical protein